MNTKTFFNLEQVIVFFCFSVLQFMENIVFHQLYYLLMVTLCLYIS